GSANIGYSVSEIPNATSYVWNLPEGVVITSGANTASISVDFTPAALSGIISVYGSNNEGNGEASNLSVTVHSLPANIGEAFGIIPDLQDSLVAYYPFNGNPNDLSENENNGEIIGNVTLTTDRFGNQNSAYLFPGEAFNYISVPNNESLCFNIFTLNAWIYTDSDYGYGQVVQKNRDIIQGHYGLYAHGVEGNVCYYCTNGAHIAELPIIGQWHMVTGTISGNDARFYLNGELVAVDTLTYNYMYSGTDPMAIGMHYYEGVPDFWTYPFKGKIDDVMVYNRSLSAEEIACLYAGECNSQKLQAFITENHICQDGSASIVIQNAQSRIQYQLFKDGEEYGSSQTGNADTLNFPINNLNETSDFTILATDTLSGCSMMLDSTFTVQVITPDAIASATLSSETVPSTVTLTSLSTDAETFEWFQNGTSISNVEHTQVVLENPGEYTFVLLAESGPPLFCSDYDTVKVIVTEPIVVKLEIPSSFTPNSDKINDNFTVLTEGITSYDIWIKDPWGILMTSFDQSGGEWDGLTTSGREAPSGAYYYHLEAVDYTNKSFDKNGTVYLIRDLVELSPNPAKDKLNLKMNGRLAGNRTIQVISLQGKVLLKEESADDKIELNIEELQPGMYVIQITNSLDLLNLKFIKEKSHE
ncbi:MAG: LamG-like jellyroll fold domain-containing protein, partial [Bacteroidales bacterium]